MEENKNIVSALVDHSEPSFSNDMNNGAAVDVANSSSINTNSKYFMNVRLLDWN